MIDTLNAVGTPSAGGSELAIDITATTLAIIPESECGKHVMGASAEWEVYNPPVLQITYPSR